jgi:hypothetical protein
MEVSFIGGGNPKKTLQPVVIHLQTVSHILVSSTPRHQRNSNSQC